MLGQLRYLGHIAVSVGRPDPRISGDTILRSARYVGPLRKMTFSADGFALSGVGMAYWLGDENDKGPIITDTLFFQGTDFSQTVSQLAARAPSVKLGTVHNVTTGYTGYHQFVTVRKALDFVCSTVTTDSTNPVEWRVNGDATLDAGRASDLYQYDPVTIIARREPGIDMHLRSLTGKASVDEDIEDYATEVILLGQGEGLGIASAQAKLDDAEIPYRDLFGNVVRIARTVSQSSTDAANSLQQAQISLNQYANPRDAVTLSTSEFDIEGDLRVGDGVWVYDPAAGMVDESPTATEMVFRGEKINPVRLRVSELTWPIEQGMSVNFRTPDGEWIDLTDYVVFETGDTTVTVGGYDRSLTNPTGRQESLGSRAAPNTSVPATPVFLPTAFVQAVYQSSQFGITKAQIQLRWLTPLNTDGTSIIDGDHYEIRYRTSDGPVYRQASNPGTDVDAFPGVGFYPGTAVYPGSNLSGGTAAVIPPGFPSTWAQVAGITWDQMDTWAQPVVYVAGPYNTAYAAFDTTQLLIQELTPGVPYQFEIRAVDNGVPPNYSSWSDPVEVIMNGDSIPPPTPAPPDVASSLIAIQVTHTLGAASGGTFNLPADMHHLEVHVGPEPTFTASEATLIGKVPANNGMIISNTPVVATLNINDTTNIYVKVVAVDEAGNRSNSSVAVQSTAQLIDDEHISNLSVSKVTAGQITADWLLAAAIQTAPSNARAGMDALGLFAYNALNQRVWEVRDDTGDMVSYAPTGVPSMRIEAATGNIYMYKPDGVTPALQLTATTGLVDLLGRVSAGDGVGQNATVVVDPNTTGSPPRPGVLMYHDSGDSHSVIYGRPNPGDSGGSRFWLANRSDLTHNNGAVIYGDADRIALTFHNETVSDDTPQGRGASLILQPDSSTGPGAYLEYVSAVGAIDQYLIISPTAGIDLNTSGLQYLAGAAANNFFLSTSSGTSFTNNGAVKTFVIDHPTDADRYLVHCTTESPTAGIEYWGTAVLDDELAVVQLPDYFEALAEADGRAVFLQPELTTIDSVQPLPRTGGARTPAKTRSIRRPVVFSAMPSEITGGRFHIIAPGAPDGARVHWQVKATRRNATFTVEPLKTDVTVAGDGPYRFIVTEEGS